MVILSWPQYEYNWLYFIVARFHIRTSVEHENIPVNMYTVCTLFKCVFLGWGDEYTYRYITYG